MIGIIILNYNTEEKTTQCVSAINDNVHEEYKIYLVDNASTDKSWSNLKRKYYKQKRIQFVASETNSGYSAGNNLGIRAALRDDCKYIMIVNPDVIFKNDVPTILKRAFENDNLIGLAAPYIYLPNGSSGQLFRTKYNFKKALFERKPLIYFRHFFHNADINIDMINVDEEAYIDGMVSGCCFMISKEALEMIGLLDENVFLYYEEYILEHKLRESKLKVKYIPQAKIIHNHVEEEERCNAFVNLHRYYSSLYYLKKYTNIKKWQFAMVYLEDIILLCLRAINDKEYRSVIGQFKTKVYNLKRNT